MIEYITDNAFYDSEFQYLNFLPKPITLQKVNIFLLNLHFAWNLFASKIKNDVIKVKCVYDSSNKTNFAYVRAYIYIF